MRINKRFMFFSQKEINQNGEQNGKENNKN